jgi:predicted nucleic acid-binding protein
MPYLVDTNILVRLAHRSDPQPTLAWEAVRALWERGERLCYTSQVLGEFWNVATRPVQARGGLGLPLDAVDRRARFLERRLVLLPDSLAVHEEWRRLLVAHAVTGVQVHNARLVAMMHIYEVSHLLTFNVTDFRRYHGITAQRPQDL